MNLHTEVLLNLRWPLVHIMFIIPAHRVRTETSIVYGVYLKNNFSKFSKYYLNITNFIGYPVVSDSVMGEIVCPNSL